MRNNLFNCGRYSLLAFAMLLMSFLGNAQVLTSHTDLQLEAERAQQRSLLFDQGALNGHFGADGVQTTCENAIPITSGSFTDMDLVCGSTDDLNSDTVNSWCSTSVYEGYGDGNEALYSYTPSADGAVTITVHNTTWTAIFVYDGCPISGSCVASISSTGNTRTLSFDVEEGVEYFIWVDSWPSPASPCVGGGKMNFDGPEPQADEPLEYCIPGATNSSRFINNFSTTGGVQNIANNGSGFSTGGYGNFFDTHTIEQGQGGAVSFSVDISGGTAGFRIWVDWNQDGEFSDSEAIWFSNSYENNHSSVFVVPTSAMLGETRMRIVSHWLDTEGDVDPCATGFTYGEFEDYKFIVSEGTGEPIDHCIPGATNSSYFINNFSTSGGVQDISNMGTGFATGGYGDYYDTHTVEQGAGETVNFSVDISGGTAGFRIWVDWNQDGIFDTTEEVAWNSNGYESSHNASFVVPADATPGETRMRIVSHWLNSQGNINPCSTNHTYGEFEDYKFIVTDNGDPIEYCIPVGTSSTYFINNFSTTGGIQNISNLGSGFSTGGYGDFYDNYAVEQVAGGTVNFEVDLGTSGQTYGFRIWVDWNQDGVFDTTEEVAWNSTTYQGSHSGDFTVPADAELGETRMRIVGHWLNSQGLIDPCSTNHSYGEFEDYKFIVSEGGDEPSVEDCSFGIPSFAEVPNAYGITSTGSFRVADDFVVEADVTFSLNQITFDTNQQGVPTNATIEIRSDNSGNPGGVLHTITMAPTNSVVVGSAFGDPIHHLTFDLATAIEFTEGTYWVVPTMVTSPAETIWWAATDEASYASTPRFSSNAGASWSTDPSGLHMVMTVSGECEDAGDEPEPGEACDIDFAISLDNGSGNTQTLLFADDFIIANGTSMSVDKVTLRIINNVNQITTLSFYEDAGGQPAATPLETFSNLTPDSQTVVGNNFGFDFYDVVVSLPTAVELDEGTYWIAYKNSIGTDGGTSFWAITNSGIGAPGKYSADDGGSWTTNTSAFHYSFKLEGECEGEATEPEPGEGPCDSKIVMDCGVQYTAQLVPNAGEWVNYTGVTYSYTGSEQVFEFTAPLTGSYLFELSQGTADADFFVMDACSNTANNLIGNYWTGNNNESITLTEGQTIFIIADLYSGASSATTVSIKVNCPEDTSALNCEDHFVESDGISNGYFFTNDLAFDIPVGDNGFNIYGVELNVFIEDSTDLDFFYTLYSDNAGLPGTAIASAFGSVISSEYAGSNYGYDVYTYVVSFDSPLSLDANTTYWMQIESDGVAWESRVGALGSNLAIDNGGGWVIDDEEFVYALVCEELGLTDLSSFDFAYYPNPVQDVLNITSQKGVKEVSIFNLTGQKVVNNAKLTQGQINVSALSPGTYIFRVVLEDGKVETFKIVKK